MKNAKLLKKLTTVVLSMAMVLSTAMAAVGAEYASENDKHPTPFGIDLSLYELDFSNNEEILFELENGIVIGISPVSDSKPTDSRNRALWVYWTNLTTGSWTEITRYDPWVNGNLMVTNPTGSNPGPLDVWLSNGSAYVYNVPLGSTAYFYNVQGAWGGGKTYTIYGRASTTAGRFETAVTDMPGV